MIISFEWPANEYEHFRPHAFDNAVGKTLPVKIGGRVTRGELLKATVHPSGATAELTFKIEDDAKLPSEPPKDGGQWSRIGDTDYG